MELRRYFSILSRWWWLILLAMLLAGGASYIVSSNSPKVYQSRARLLLESAPGGSNNEYAQLLFDQKQAATFAARMTAEPILEETIDELNLPLTVGQLRGKVSVSAPEELQILEVLARDVSSVRAAQIANTLAEVFVENEAARQTSRYDSSIVLYEEQKESLRDQIEQVEVDINSLQEASTAEDKAKLSRLETLERELQLSFTRTVNDLEALRVSQIRDANDLVIYEPATPAVSHISPLVGRNTLLATIIGAMGAIGVILLLDYLDDTVKSPEEIQEDTGLSTLGVIAEIPGTTPNQMLVSHHTPRSPTSEAFRALRTNLGFSAIDGGLHSMLVTSASPGEGKSTVASNLATVMAQAGKKVLLVDADLRLPKQHKIFNVANNQGLTTALLDSETPLADHFQKTPIRGMSLMTSGPLPPNPSELLNSKRMKQIFENLSHEADIVIFDTPPVLTVADAAILGAQVNGCILVGEVNKTNRSAIVRAIVTLQNTGGTVFGVVLNKLNLKRLGYYDYYYHYQYYAYDYNTRKKNSQGRFGWLGGWLPGFSNRS